MALITCPECGKPVSTMARACPACGYPMAAATSPTTANPPTAPAVTATLDTQTVLLEVRPSWWNFGWHIVFFWLVIPLLIALYRRHTFVMRIYPDRVAVEQGFWSKDSREFFIRDIRTVDVRQGIWSRLAGIGDVTISTAASVDAAEIARGVPDPKGIKALLIAQRQQSAT